jgi:hypothetical protein
MVTSEWDNQAERAKMINLHATEQIEERFRRIFKRDMTPEERYSFFMPEEELKKSSG